MANLGTTFDASTVDPTSSYDVLPPGQYVVQIVQSEMRPTKNGQGQLLALELDILEGDHVGRKLFDRLNLVNPNAQTVEIAQRTETAAQFVEAMTELGVSAKHEVVFTEEE